MMHDSVEDGILTVGSMAERARKEYASTKETTTSASGTCSTIRVPVALLNRIRELAEIAGVSIPK